MTERKNDKFIAGLRAISGGVDEVATYRGVTDAYTLQIRSRDGQAYAVKLAFDDLSMVADMALENGKPATCASSYFKHTVDITEYFDANSDVTHRVLDVSPRMKITFFVQDMPEGKANDALMTRIRPDDTLQTSATPAGTVDDGMHNVLLTYSDIGYARVKAALAYHKLKL